MTVHHCPKCELAFALKAEVEDHCWHDHPEFRHEYPAREPQEPVGIDLHARLAHHVRDQPHSTPSP